MNTTLITGISGFAGSFLSSHLISETDDRIVGTYHSGKGLKHVEELGDRITARKVNVLKADELDSLIEEVKPDRIYHLAALASPSLSFKDPAKTFETNISGQINLLESVRKHNLKDTKILVISSAEVYGLVKEDDLPIDENTPLNPTSPYAVSKIAQDYLGLQYAHSYDMNIVRVRPFNHIGPRQSAQYVVSSFASQIAEIEKGKKEPVLRVGNLKAKRDFTDVRDIVGAYHLVLEKGGKGDLYNIGSGISYEVFDILEKLIGKAKVSISVEVDTDLFKPADVPELICDKTKLTEHTGWEPQISIDTSLTDILDYWRNLS